MSHQPLGVLYRNIFCDEMHSFTDEWQNPLLDVHTSELKEWSILRCFSPEPTRNETGGRRNWSLFIFKHFPPKSVFSGHSVLLVDYLNAVHEKLVLLATTATL